MLLLALASLGAVVATSEAQGWTGIWTEKAYPPPGPRGWVDLTFDTVNGRAVLFGGSASQYMNDVWQYDAATDRWVQLESFVRCPTDFTPPTGRDEYSLEYDPIKQLYWVFGGSGFGCNGPARTAGVGTTTLAIVDPTLTATTVNFYKDWTVLIVDGTGTERTAFVSTYDPVSKTLTLATPVAIAVPGRVYFLYPQRGGGTFSYSPVTRSWSSLTGPHWGYTGPHPSNRLSPAMAYSTRDTAIVMFGGQGWNDTWALDAQTKSWVQMIPYGATGSPPGLAQLTNSMVYDSDDDVFILFGGCLCTGDGGPASNDTWVYRLSTNTWTKMSTIGSPPPRHGHNLVYDTANKVAVLFGGYDVSGPAHYNDLWVYQYATNTWTQVFPSISPPGRRTGAMVYDPVQQLTVLYGGKNPGSLRDVWALQLQGSGPSNPAPSLTSLSPTSAAAGSPSFTITVTGANFVSSSVVRWNGASRPTTYVRSTQLQASIPATDIASVGTAQVSVVTPAPGGGTSSPLSFTVSLSAASEVILDNAPVGTQGATRSFTGTWCVSGATGFFGTNSLYSCGAGADTYRWTPTLAAAQYNVYVWWTQHVNRSTSVPIAVTHAGGTTPKTFNQQTGGGQWVLHGRYSFNAGPGGFVQVSDASGQAAADAVRFVPVAADTTPPDTSITGGPTGTIAVGSATFTWTGTDAVTPTGGLLYAYRLDPLEPSFSAFGAATTKNYSSLGNGPYTFFVKAKDAAGNEDPTPASRGFTVSLSAASEVILDNAPVGTQGATRSFTGTWCVSGATGFFGTNSLYSCGAGADTYRWTPTLAAAQYDVYVWWTQHVNRSTSVPIAVTHAGGTTPKTFNQQTGGGQWVLHGRYSFNAGTGGFFVQVSDASGQAAADAVRFVPVP